MGLYDRDYMR